MNTICKQITIEGRTFLAESSEPSEDTITDEDGTWKLTGQIHEHPPLPANIPTYSEVA